MKAAYPWVEQIPRAAVAAAAWRTLRWTTGGALSEFRLTVVRGQGDPTPLSPTYDFKMNSFVAGGQQLNIVFQRNY